MRTHIGLQTLVIWLAYLAYEILYIPTGCGGHYCDIRVDLLVLWPLLLILTIRYFKYRKSNKSKSL